MDALHKHMMDSLHLKRGEEVQTCILAALRGAKLRVDWSIDHKTPHQSWDQAKFRVQSIHTYNSNITPYYSVIIITIRAAQIWKSGCLVVSLLHRTPTGSYIREIPANWRCFRCWSIDTPGPSLLDWEPAHGVSKTDNGRLLVQGQENTVSGVYRQELAPSGVAANTAKRGLHSLWLVIDHGIFLSSHNVCLSPMYQGPGYTDL